MTMSTTSIDKITVRELASRMGKGIVHIIDLNRGKNGLVANYYRTQPFRIDKGILVDNSDPYLRWYTPETELIVINPSMGIYATAQRPVYSPQYGC